MSYYYGSKPCDECWDNADIVVTEPGKSPVFLCRKHYNKRCLARLKEASSEISKNASPKL